MESMIQFIIKKNVIFLLQSYKKDLLTLKEIQKSI